MAVVFAAAVVLLFPSVGVAHGDEAGYCTVSGVVGIDEDAWYETLPDALYAVSTCDPAEQPEGSVASVIVHGTLSVDVQESESGVFEFSYPVPGSGCAVIGVDGARIDAYDSSGSWRPLALANPSGALSLRGVSTEYPVSLSCGGSLSVEDCSFGSSVVCGSWSDITFSANRFDPQGPSAHAALNANLMGPGGALVFSNNYVGSYAVGVVCNIDDASSRATFTQPSAHAALNANLMGPGGALVFSNNYVGSYAVGVVCNIDDASSRATFTQNTFSLDVAAADPASMPPCAVLLEGGPWEPSAIAYRDNVLSANAEVPVFAAGSSCFAAAPYDVAEVVRGLANVAGEEVAENPSITIVYDANGATAGAAPDPVSIEPGQPTTVSHMGSLVNTGYVFEGWSTTPDGSGPFYAVGQVILPESDMVLYAQWAPTGTVGTYAVTPVESHDAAAVEAA